MKKRRNVRLNIIRLKILVDFMFTDTIIKIKKVSAHTWSNFCKYWFVFGL